jgi:four helix bundle protein
MRSHKSLLAWQEANAVVMQVMSVTKGNRHPCVNQLQRATLSVQLNIAEGYAYRSPKRFRNHLDIAYASAVESGDLVEICGQMELLTSDLAAVMLQRCHRCQQLIRGLINRLRHT